MPFKLFHTKSKKGKSSSFNGSDLSDRKCEEPPDGDHKTHHKNVLHFFSSSKSNGHVHFKSINPDKIKKVKGTDVTSHSLKTKSLTNLTLDGNKNVHSTDPIVSDHSNTAGPHCKPRSASYTPLTDSLSREKLLSEIAQLDTYMKYLRKTEDEGNMASRLCCAQVLKMSLLRLDRRHVSSQERIDMCHKRAANRSPPPYNGSEHYNQKQLNCTIAHEANASASSLEKDDNGNVHDAVSSDSVSRGSDDSEDSCSVQSNLTSLKLAGKNGTTPVWPRDIEIF